MVSDDGPIVAGGIPPAGFPRNDYRGIPLAGLSDALAQRLADLAGVDAGLPVPARAIGDLWQDAVAAPIDVAEACIHGDLHPRNLVVSEGRLAAMLDWGDMTAGDQVVLIYVARL